MTPEQLEEIPGIGPELVENIQEAVNAYYNQFEEQSASQEASESESGSESLDAQKDASAVAPAAEAAGSEEAVPEPAENVSAQQEGGADANRSDTMEVPDSPTENQTAQAVPEDAGEDGRAQ